MYQTIEDRINQQIQNMEKLSDTAIIGKIEKFIRQRPGLSDNGWYSGISTDYKHVAADKYEALRALGTAEYHAGYNGGLNRKALATALERAYSGRLSFDQDGEIVYSAGQYWPTEYRAACAAVLKYYIRELDR